MAAVPDREREVAVAREGDRLDHVGVPAAPGDQSGPPVVAAASGSGGVSGPAFYVDGVLYRTVGTPTDLSGTGTPDHSFDVIYNLGGEPAYTVATVAPGDPAFNGCRWSVHRITFTDYESAVATYDLNGSDDFDSAVELEAALAAGAAIDAGIVRQFVCTVVPVPGRP